MCHAHDLVRYLCACVFVVQRAHARVAVSDTLSEGIFVLQWLNMLWQVLLLLERPSQDARRGAGGEQYQVRLRRQPTAPGTILPSTIPATGV